MLSKKLLRGLRIDSGKKFRLKDYPPDWAAIPELASRDKTKIEERARALLAENRKELEDSQELLWANDVWSVLVILQAMDTAGKDGVIKHVMSGLNPQGCHVVSFKRPSDEELDHNFLWRYMQALPERGKIGIFNRSHYEEVLIVRVRDDVLQRQRLPAGKRDKQFWNHRYDDINRFEKHLARNGTLILKFFLHISTEEQRRRLIERLKNPRKRWKFELGDLAERARWDDYMDAYERALAATSTRWAPWHVIPADNKWITRALVGSVLANSLRKLALKLPTVPDSDLKAFAQAQRQLEKEEG
jgi:PPK2 family polyphosphate:nucleotide phosphotransferase